MKVVRIIARLNVGGPARHVVWLTAELPRAGYESVLVTGVVPPGEDDMSYFARALGVVPRIIPEMSREISWRDAVTVWKLYRLLRRERPDIVHTHTAKAGTVGRVAGLCYRWLTPGMIFARPRRCRFVHTYHGHVFHSYYGAAKTRFFLTIEKILARFATDRIIVISPQQYREIHTEFSVGRDSQFAVIPLGLDLGAFDKWSERRAAAREAFGIMDDSVLVGVVGRLTEIKNHELFLEAVALCKKESGRMEGSATTISSSPRVRFLIVGDGHLRPALEARARVLGVDEDVMFTGLRDDPENFYAALDVVALTSRNEGTPLTLIEAMANARPVVAMAVGGVVDLLGPVTRHPTLTEPAHDDGYLICERGLRVPAGDAQAFSRALRRIIDDENLRGELGERGRVFVRNNYSKERLVVDISNLYNDLLRPTTLAVATVHQSSRFNNVTGDR
ncbi:MAG: glycosyltransferase [Acidobacteriota bacterium]|nr:glycosyltransferase [Acidobacteriota bacterium]